jgi:hypothetical protein
MKETGVDKLRFNVFICDLLNYAVCYSGCVASDGRARLVIMNDAEGNDSDLI